MPLNDGSPTLLNKASWCSYGGTAPKISALGNTRYPTAASNLSSTPPLLWFVYGPAAELPSVAGP